MLRILEKKMKKIRIIILLILVLIAFFVGFIIGKNRKGELKNILNINQWDVKTFSNEKVIIYEASSLDYIAEEQRDGWKLLTEQISMVGYKRHETKGNATHIKYKIEMKNGDIYYIEDLGCNHQVDITFPNNKTIKYYAYS